MNWKLSAGSPSIFAYVLLLVITVLLLLHLMGYPDDRVNLNSSAQDRVHCLERSQKVARKGDGTKPGLWTEKWTRRHTGVLRAPVASQKDRFSMRATTKSNGGAGIEPSESQRLPLHP